MRHKHTDHKGGILPLDKQTPIFDAGQAFYRDPSTGRLFTPCSHTYLESGSGCKWCDPRMIFERHNPGQKHPDNEPVCQSNRLEDRLRTMFENSREEQP